MRNNTKKKIAPIVVAVLVVAYVGPLVALMAYAAGLLGAQPEARAALPFLLLYLVAGGADGVTVVPRERVEEILDNAEAKQKLDLAMQAKIDAYLAAAAKGEPLPKLMPSWIEELLR